MHLELSEEQQLLRDTFDQLFGTESSPDRVRAAESSGFDKALWQQLIETGALGIRVPESAGGVGGTLLEAAVVAEQAGRHLATGPVIESIAGWLRLRRGPRPSQVQPPLRHALRWYGCGGGDARSLPPALLPPVLSSPVLSSSLSQFRPGRTPNLHAAATARAATPISRPKPKKATAVLTSVVSCR